MPPQLLSGSVQIKVCRLMKTLLSSRVLQGCPRDIVIYNYARTSKPKSCAICMLRQIMNTDGSARELVFMHYVGILK